ncbi:MAG: hypothetical protein IJQ97_07490 [Paludibacteraceae bacterium]|nr:hypothetical protein [Paludibacteraceae bacterium]
MEATTRTLQVTLPVADAAFLRRLSSNMGWTVKAKRAPRTYYDSPSFYSDIDAAEEDIKAGKGVRVDSKEALDALFS